MVITIGSVLLILAWLCFVAAAFRLDRPPVNLVALGLSLWVLSLLVR